ncbi:hypothetical protein R9C00_12270 [Flammeovirgaceae bacterium SG7u.111]|nr:hypothetical protein R9C00_12270 [Flammeovirgaceae bacterium SG7u.111]
MRSTPKKTVDAILEGGNHYVIQVKRNQPSLFNEIQDIIVNDIPLDFYETHEKGHGRRSSWYVTVYDASFSYKAKEWGNLQRLVHVHALSA